MLNIHDLYQEVAKLAQQYPEAIYKRPDDTSICNNYRGKVLYGPETDGCIIGQAIRILLGDTGRHIDLDGNSAACMIDEFFNYVRTENSYKKRKVLILTQDSQDRGDTWGEAFNKARKVIGI